jgi:uracil-DNA glycosylase
MDKAKKKAAPKMDKYKAKKKAAPKIGFGERFGSLEELKKEFRTCQRCTLSEECAGRTTLARGDHAAEIMIVGESPGEEEFREGTPFVGPSGGFLCYAMVAAHHLIDPALADYAGDEEHPEVHQIIDDNFYITNAVMCYPGDRKPTTREYRACRNRLWNEIYLVDPKMIIALGKQAAESLLSRPVAITTEHGKMFKARIPGLVRPYIEYPVMTLVHPAFVLREGEESKWAVRFVQDLDLALTTYHKTMEILGGDHDGG